MILGALGHLDVLHELLGPFDIVVIVSMLLIPGGESATVPISLLNQTVWIGSTRTGGQIVLELFEAFLSDE